MKRAFAAIIISLLIAVEVCSAQSVGIVMNGGGAKGLYHVGVLEALEEKGVPIDYVAGTSIGAIVSGLYAAGYSTDEMRKLALSGELEKWVSGKIDRNLGAYVRRGSTLYKENPTLSFNIGHSPNIDVDSIAHMPKSLISTTQIDMALNELFAPATVACEGDFSQLMIPFLCVTSDVTDDKAVVLKSGDMGKAIRASMAIPIAFKPVLGENGHIYYDGGMHDNFPWKAMNEAFEPDLIIGSICGKDTWANTKSLSILDQAFLLAMNQSDYEITTNNVIVEREVPTSMLDFSRSEEIIQMGYDDTMEQMEQILSQIGRKNLKTKEYYTQRRQEFRDRSPELIFDSYTNSGLNEFQDKYAQSFMATTKRERRMGAEEQREMSFEELRDSLYTILSDNEFVTNYPSVSYDSDSERYQFDIEMEHKPSLRVSLSGYLSSTQFNQIYLGVNYKTIKRFAQSISGELYLGPVYTIGRLGYRADFYMRTPMFVDAYFDSAVKNLNRGSFGQLTHIDNSLGMKSSEQHFSIGIGAPIGQNSLALIRANVGSSGYGYSNGLPMGINSVNATDRFYDSNLNYAAVKVEAERCTINNLHYPTDGSQLTLSAIAVKGREKSFASNNTPQDNKYEASRSWIGCKAALTQYYSTSARRNLILGVSAEAVYTNIPEMFSSSASTLYMPYYAPTAHSNMVYMPEYSAPRYVGMGLMPSIKLHSNLYLQTQFYAMMRDKYDPITYKVTDLKGTFCFKYISQASFVYETNLGPASLSLTKYNIENWNNLYLTLSFGYSIFAPRGTFY